MRSTRVFLLAFLVVFYLRLPTHWPDGLPSQATISPNSQHDHKLEAFCVAGFGASLARPFHPLTTCMGYGVVVRTLSAKEKERLGAGESLTVIPSPQPIPCPPRKPTCQRCQTHPIAHLSPLPHPFSLSSISAAHAPSHPHRHTATVAAVGRSAALDSGCTAPATAERDVSAAPQDLRGL